MRHEVTLDVKAHYKMVPKDDIMRCKEMEDSDDTEFECYSRCRMEMIRNVCKCTAATISSLVKDAAELEKYPICDYTKCDIRYIRAVSYLFQIAVRKWCNSRISPILN